MSVMKLKNVRPGTMFKHMGVKRIDKKGAYKPQFLPTFPQDKGMVCLKLSDSQQQAVITGQSVIFGLNDMVEVL